MVPGDRELTELQSLPRETFANVLTLRLPDEDSFQRRQCLRAHPGSCGNLVEAQGIFGKGIVVVGMAGEVKAQVIQGPGSIALFGRLARLDQPGTGVCPNLEFVQAVNPASYE